MDSVFQQLLSDLHNAGMSDKCEEYFVHEWNVWQDRPGTLQEMRRKLEILTKPKEVPLHEQEMRLQTGSNNHSWSFVVGGEHPPVPLEYGERIVACWNACKGIPTKDIVAPPGKYWGRAVAKKTSELCGLVAVIRPLIAQWERQKNMFPILRRDGWMDDAISNVVSEIKRVGLGGMLENRDVSPICNWPLFYFTLGNAYAHNVILADGTRCIWDKDGVLVVQAEDWDRARDLVNGTFGDTWSHQYSEMTKSDMLMFPKGFIVPDFAWLRQK